MNKVTLHGYLGGNPENNKGVVKASLATTEKWYDKNTGELQERTEWHRLTMFGKVGERAAEYLDKGSEILLEGSLRTNKWQDDNGNNRYTTEIIVSNWEFCGSKPKNAENSGNPVVSDTREAEMSEVDGFVNSNGEAQDVPF